MGKVVLPNDILLDEVARLLSEGRDVVMTPKGRSMLPFIRGEVDCVVLRQLPKVEVGDIVIIMAYAIVTPEEGLEFKPKVVFPDTATNRLIKKK